MALDLILSQDGVKVYGSKYIGSKYMNIFMVIARWFGVLVILHIAFGFIFAVGFISLSLHILQTLFLLIGLARKSPGTEYTLEGRR